MPTMTDPKTGETKEISMEEFMEVLQKSDGTASIQQIVTDANGNKTVTDIYGNKSGEDDGIDRSLNIFVDSDLVVKFGEAAYSDLEKNEEDPDDPDAGKYKGFIMTIDYTDAAITWVMTSTEESVKLCAYNRDDRKSNTHPEITGEWKKENGQVTISQEEVNKDKNILYLLCFGQMRKYLKRQGIVAKLREFDNRGAGVVITSENGSFSAKIVRGKNRPDLPCNVFLLGEQMCRPYPDEMMGLTMSAMSLEEKIEAAENGDEETMDYLALAYLNGDSDEGIEADPEKAFYWYQKLAEAGNATGMFNLGLFYAKGYTTDRDFSKALEWMEKAAEAGDDDAPRLVEEYGKMVNSWSAAEAGDAQAQADLASGLMALGGSLAQAGEGKDYTESVFWAEKSAKQDNGDGIWVLALAYEHGRGVERDVNKAIELYRRGAELGHAKCQHSLGCYYLRGDVIPKDEKKGFELSLKSAEQGYGLGMKTVGSCYQFATGCTGNMKTAVEWYEKALKVIDDPELERKVIAFKQLAKIDPSFGEDYGSGDQEDTLQTEQADTANLPEGYLEQLDKVIKEDEQKQEALNREAEAYLEEMKSCFTSTCKEWESYKEEVPKKFLELVKQGMKPSISTNHGSYSGRNRTLGVTLNFETDMTAAKNYVESLKTEIPERGKVFSDRIDEFEPRLLEYQREGIVRASIMNRLAAHFVEWIDYALNLNIQIKERRITVQMPERYSTLKTEWEQVASAQSKKAEAEEYGVSEENLAIHKSYLTACSDRDSAKTAYDMFQVEQQFINLGGYLDSEEQATATHDKAVVLEQKEEKARQEALRKENEQKREIEQYKKDYRNWETRCNEILNERKTYVEEKIGIYQKEIEEQIHQVYEAEIEKLKQEIADQENIETAATAKLSSLGLFKFSEKKEQRTIIENAQARITSARNSLRDKEREFREKLSASAEEAKKATQKYNVKAIEEIPFPDEPVKPKAVLMQEKKEEERRRKEEEEAKRQEELKNMPTPEEKEALLCLGSYGTTADEVADIMGISRLKANSLLIRLISKGKAERYVERRVTYYKRKD